jgi:site-specific DNA-methyltransferase (adenine-specific)
MSIRLLHGDCLEIMKDISANSVDLILCDLPYGCLSQPRAVLGPGWRKIKEKGEIPKVQRNDKELCAWDIKIDLTKFWEQVKRILKNDHSPVIHFCTTKFGYELINSNPDWFRYDLVWDKQRGVSFLSANKMPMRSHEMIYVFSKKGAFYERKDIAGDFKSWKVKGEGRTSQHYGGAKRINTEGGDGTRCVFSVINLSKSTKKGNHPTEKPESLYRFLIERYCPVDGTVLDPTFGSGNSVMTAYAMGRHAIGIEKDDVFYKKCSDKIIPETYT